MAALLLTPLFIGNSISFARCKSSAVQTIDFTDRAVHAHAHPFIEKFNKYLARNELIFSYILQLIKGSAGEGEGKTETVYKVLSFALSFRFIVRHTEMKWFVNMHWCLELCYRHAQSKWKEKNIFFLNLILFIKLRQQ